LADYKIGTITKDELKRLIELQKKAVADEQKKKLAPTNP
jgi:hypothetical protein